MSLMLDPSPTLPFRLLLLFPSVLLDDLDFDDPVDDAIDFSERFFSRDLSFCRFLNVSGLTTSVTLGRSSLTRSFLPLLLEDRDLDELLDDAMDFSDLSFGSCDWPFGRRLETSGLAISEIM